MARVKDKAIVCDIDETLILSGLLADIHLNKELYSVLTKYKKRHGYKIILLTNRHEQFRRNTMQTLESFHVSYDAIYMNNSKDAQHIFKKRIMKDEIMNKYDVQLFIDDTEANLNTISELGIVTILPNEIKLFEKGTI